MSSHHLMRKQIQHMMQGLIDRNTMLLNEAYKDLPKEDDQEKQGPVWQQTRSITEDFDDKPNYN